MTTLTANRNETDQATDSNPWTQPRPDLLELQPGAVFRLRVAGDCMAPKFRDGQRLELRIIPRAEMRRERSYLICRNDGTATFRQFVRGGEQTITLRAINRVMDPERIKVAIGDIRWVAAVDGVFIPC